MTTTRVFWPATRRRSAVTKWTPIHRTTGDDVTLCGLPVPCDGPVVNVPEDEGDSRADGNCGKCRAVVKERDASTRCARMILTPLAALCARDKASRNRCYTMVCMLLGYRPSKDLVLNRWLATEPGRFQSPSFSSGAALLMVQQAMCGKGGKAKR